MLKITLGKGFQLTFPNGWTASVQFGWGNYCDNQHIPNDFVTTPRTTECVNAEVAAWDADGEWYSINGSDVKGYMDVTQVMEFLNMIAAKH